MILALLCATAAAGAPVVTDIDVQLEGRGNTAESSLLRMMNTRKGAPLNLETLEYDLRRLRATQVLTDVSTEVEEEEGEEGGELITLHVRDRWSFLPVFGLRHGGGRTTTRVGIIERNLLGRLVTLSGELQSATSIPFSDPSRIGSVVSLLVPRIDGTRVSAAVLWRREFLDYSGWDANGNSLVIYDRTRHSIFAEARYELSGFASMALQGTGIRDGYGLDGASPATLGVPANGRTGLLGVELLLGTLDDRVVTLEGAELRLRLEGARAGALSDFSFGTASAVLRWFTLPRPTHNFGVLLSAGMTSAMTDSNLFRAGGLTEIRGFPDAYFLGQRLLRANLEYRLEVLRTQLFIPAVTQLAAFVDGGHISGRAQAVGGLDYQGPIASVGGGVRFILLPITRAVARVDFAVGMYPRQTFDVSLGGQQFF